MILNTSLTTACIYPEKFQFICRKYKKKLEKGNDNNNMKIIFKMNSQWKFSCVPDMLEKEEKSGETAAVVALLAKKRKCFKIYFAKIRKMQNVKLLK